MMVFLDRKVRRWFLIWFSLQVDCLVKSKGRSIVEREYTHAYTYMYTHVYVYTYMYAYNTEHAFVQYLPTEILIFVKNVG